VASRSRAMQALRTREVSPLELTEAYLARIGALDLA
jgi:Asp-tRNA(Asn)/Glu-tRNA(Gln) amidotransferase A subunit family amidase